MAPATFPPLCVLVDADPDGIAIMSTYKYGSIAHSHENSRLDAPQLEWIGTRISDSFGGIETGSLIPLRPRDVKKARDMLTRNPVLADGGPEPEWRAQLQTMLMLNMKAETEILYDWEGGLEQWIDQKLLTMLNTRAAGQCSEQPRGIQARSASVASSDFED